MTQRQNYMVRVGGRRYKRDYWRKWRPREVTWLEGGVEKNLFTVVGKGAKGRGVVRLDNRCGPRKSGVLLKKQTFPIAAPPFTTWCGKYREGGF